jgi:spore germination protein
MIRSSVLFAPLIFFGIVSAMTIANASAAQSVQTKLRAQSWAYQAWWLPQSWRQVPLNNVDRILFFDLKVGADGLISDRNGWPERWGDFRVALTEAGTPLDLTLSILNAKDFQSLFSSPLAVRQLLSQSMGLMKDSAVAGIHLDFEVYTAMPESTLKRFRQFVVALSYQLHQQKNAKSISIFLPMGGVSQIYDAKALASIDKVVAQGYDAHWVTGPSAGPVAPIDGESAVTWKKAVAHASALGVKGNRLLMSYPLYGYEWPTADKNPRGATRGEGAITTLIPIDQKLLPAVQVSSQERTQSFGAINDLVSGSSYYQFQKGGQWTTGWFEGQWALGKKMDFVREQKLRGIAFFVMGYDGGKLINSFGSARGAYGF